MACSRMYGSKCRARKYPATSSATVATAADTRIASSHLFCFGVGTCDSANLCSRRIANYGEAVSPHFSWIAERNGRDAAETRRATEVAAGVLEQYVEAADRAQRSSREHIGRCSRQFMRNAG